MENGVEKLPMTGGGRDLARRRGALQPFLVERLLSSFSSVHEPCTLIVYIAVSRFWNAYLYGDSVLCCLYVAQQPSRRRNNSADRLVYFTVAMNNFCDEQAADLLHKSERTGQSVTWCLVLEEVL